MFQSIRECKIFKHCYVLTIKYISNSKESLNSPQDWGQIGVKLGATHIKVAHFMQKGIFMLTGVKVSSLPCRFVFYRTEHINSGIQFCCIENNNKCCASCYSLYNRKERNAKGVPIKLNFKGFELQYQLYKKMKLSIKDFFNKCGKIRRKLRTCSHLLKKYLMENFIFCAVNDQIKLKDQMKKLGSFNQLSWLNFCIFC